MTKINRDPWAEIGKPSDAAHLSTRRVAVGGRWDFFWAKDSENNCGLVLLTQTSAIPLTRLPHLKGIELKVQSSGNENKASLMLRLLDSEKRDIFFELCQDIMGSAMQAASEQDAVARTVTRTWRWHYLLRGGTGLLSSEEQIGLIGELTLLESVFVPHCGPNKAVNSWRGPLGGVQDFSVGSLRVEAKARGQKRSSELHISSEHQLEVPVGGTLFLSVGIFEPTNDEDSLGNTVTEVALRVRQLIASLDAGALPKFDALLAAAGLDLSDDYVAWKWREKQRSVFIVREGFPRIVPGNLPPGVTGVRYGLSLPGCGEFLVPISTLTDALGEDENA